MLKRVFWRVILKNQTTFLLERQLLDGVAVINENADLVKRRKL